MLIQLNDRKDRVIFTSEGGPEYKFLNEFPAFLKQGPIFTLPAKPWVLHNVLSRIQLYKKTNIKISDEALTLSKRGLKLHKIPESFQYHTKPMDFQEIALRFLYTLGSAGILLDPGMGKSKVILDYIFLKIFKKSLVICPRPLLFVWEDEIKIHRPELTFHTVLTTEWEQELPGILAADVTIVNYTKVSLMLNQFKTIPWDFMHLDEFLIKDSTTNRTIDITALSRQVPFRAGGSGTLINNTVMDVYSPVNYLEPALVGEHPAPFFNHHVITNYSKVAKRNIVVAFHRMEEARSALESCCIVMTKEEWLKNMPAKVFHDIYVKLPEEQSEIYSSFIRNMAARFQGEIIEIDNSLVMMSKLYQVSNGFLYVPFESELGADEKSLAVNNDLEDLFQENQKSGRKKAKRKTLFFKDQPKLDALRTLVTKTIPGQRAILWFNMSAEFEMITNMLTLEGKSFLSIRGGDPNIGKKVRQFNNDPTINYLVCQAKAVNYGITVLGTTKDKLEEADYEVFPGMCPEVFTEIFYSINFSLEVFLQQQDRIHRLGQINTCHYYRLFAITSIERRMLDAIDDKMVLRKTMLVDIAHEIRKEGQELV